ncbi:DUF1972 domain-containing protein [Chryseolinea sp. T2]|uniref:DUF1972 domain-containing protein n=1 Tax=Chryseolinea sp. T2 TaxID=3129255 RepID=UPI003077FBB0
MTLAIVGTRGIPNNYGGFETLAEQLVEYLSREFEITVYCSSKDMPSTQHQFNGAKLHYLPITSHGAMGMVYDSIALIHAIKRFDKVLFLGFGAGFVMPLVRRYRSKIVVNIGGLDWTRNKWSGFARNVIKTCEVMLVRNSGSIVSDNIGIQEYIKTRYGLSSSLIAYGGDQATKEEWDENDEQQYGFLGKPYAFIVTRIQPDNNIEMILDAFRQQSALPLVMVGNWNNSGYGRNLRLLYSGQRQLVLLDAIYDRKKLNTLRSNCTIYIHGHSAGGTNPSLVEAMFLQLPVFAFASGYNEHTTRHSAMYFRDSHDLLSLVENYKRLDLDSMAEKLKEIADHEYRWNIIASKYQNVLTSNTLNPQLT